MSGLFIILFLVSLAGLIFGLLKPDLFLRFIKGNQARKKIGLLFGGLALVFFIVAVATTDTNQQATKPVADSTQVTKETSQESGDEVEEKVEGIEVSRSKVINALEKPSIGFSFEEGLPVKGQENYVANKGGNIVQLLGPEDNLREASIIAFIGSDSGENIKSLAMVIGFANVIDENSVDWVTQEFEKVAKDTAKSYSNFRVFGQKRLEISFEPSELFTSFSLVVKPGV